MQPIGKILQKIKQVKFRHLKRFLEDHLGRKSQNCLYNRSSLLSFQGQEAVCICGHAFETNDWVAGACDVRVNPDLARTCDKYEAQHQKAELKKAFNNFLETSDIASIAKHYPDLAALLWVVDEEDFEDKEEES